MTDVQEFVKRGRGGRLSLSAGEDLRDVIDEVNFENSDVSDMLVSRVQLDYCSFSDSRIRSVKFVDSVLMGVSFMGASVIDSTFSETLIYGLLAFESKYSGCTFSSTTFQGCNLEGCRFHGCSFVDVEFSEDNMRHRTDLTDAEFIGCRFHNVSAHNVMGADHSLLRQKNVRLVHI